ncbi:MAG: hypothetical protein ABSG18_21955 [Steroidobacteraceae bacterium]|jgi:hypothetical protein
MRPPASATSYGVIANARHRKISAIGPALLIVAHTRARAEGRARIRAAAPPIYFWRIRFALLDGGGGRGVVR